MKTFKLAQSYTVRAVRLISLTCTQTIELPQEQSVAIAQLPLLRGESNGSGVALPIPITGVQGLPEKILQLEQSNFSGSYTDLSNKPTLFSGSYADLSGKPTLFSGSYADLTDKPTLFSGSYADLTAVPLSFPTTWSQVADKPTLFSGSYNDLTDKPTSSSGYSVIVPYTNPATIFSINTINTAVPIFYTINLDGDGVYLLTIDFSFGVKTSGSSLSIRVYFNGALYSGSSVVSVGASTSSALQCRLELKLVKVGNVYKVHAYNYPIIPNQITALSPSFVTFTNTQAGVNTVGVLVTPASSVSVNSLVIEDIRLVKI